MTQFIRSGVLWSPMLLLYFGKSVHFECEDFKYLKLLTGFNCFLILLIKISHFHFFTWNRYLILVYLWKRNYILRLNILNKILKQTRNSFFLVEKEEELLWMDGSGFKNVKIQNPEPLGRIQDYGLYKLLKGIMVS